MVAELVVPRITVALTRTLVFELTSLVVNRPASEMPKVELLQAGITPLFVVPLERSAAAAKSPNASSSICVGPVINTFVMNGGGLNPGAGKPPPPPTGTPPVGGCVLVTVKTIRLS